MYSGLYSSLVAYGQQANEGIEMPLVLTVFAFVGIGSYKVWNYLVTEVSYGATSLPF